MWWRNYSLTLIEWSQKIFKLSSRSLVLTWHKAFLKNKNRSGTNHFAWFSAWLSARKIFLTLYSINWRYSLLYSVLLTVFTSWDIGQYVSYNCFLTRFDLSNFEIDLIFLIEPLFQHFQKAKRKNLNIFRIKRAFKTK